MKARNCRWSRDSPGALPATNEIEGLFDEPGAAFDFHLLRIGSFQAKGHAKVRFDPGIFGVAHIAGSRLPFGNGVRTNNSRQQNRRTETSFHEHIAATV